MKENIIIIGNGISTGMMGEAMAHLGKTVIIVDDKSVKKEQLSFHKSEPFVLENHYHATTGINFICKGKHQYRLADTIKKDMGEGVLVTEVWRCQCGKVLG